MGWIWSLQLVLNENRGGDHCHRRGKSNRWQRKKWWQAQKEWWGLLELGDCNTEIVAYGIMREIKFKTIVLWFRLIISGYLLLALALWDVEDSQLSQPSLVPKYLAPLKIWSCFLKAGVGKLHVTEHPAEAELELANRPEFQSCFSAA